MSIDPRAAAQRIVNAHESVEKEAVRGLAYYEMHAADRNGALIVARALLASSPPERGAEAIEAALYGPEPIRVEGQTVVLICKDNWEAKVLARALLPSGEITRLRAKEKDWTEVFEAQKSIIGRLTDTLLEIKRENQHYNFGSKLVRIVDTALKAVP